MILYTSGTTGRPKGVMMPTDRSCGSPSSRPPVPGDASEMVMLVIAPTYNTAGINEQSIPTFLAGGTVEHLPEPRLDARDDGAADRPSRATHTLVFPSMMEPFLEAEPTSRVSSRVACGSSCTGGRELPTGDQSRASAGAGTTSGRAGYGLDRDGRRHLDLDEELDRHPGSVGRAAVGMTYQVVDGEGRAVPVGEIGEIWHRRAARSYRGYWNAPELTAADARRWLDQPATSAGWTTTATSSSRAARRT